MKKTLLTLIIMTLLISGCSGETKDPKDTENQSVGAIDNSSIEDENQQEQSETNINFNKFTGAPGDAVALIINLPTQEQMSTLKVSQVLNLQETDEKIIFIPRYEHSEVKVYSLDFDGDVERFKTCS
jgi:PBP1b-binding outer membrane lipoprotein LpoB